MKSVKDSFSDKFVKLHNSLAKNLRDANSFNQVDLFLKIQVTINSNFQTLSNDISDGFEDLIFSVWFFNNFFVTLCYKIRITIKKWQEKIITKF